MLVIYITAVLFLLIGLLAGGLLHMWWVYASPPQPSSVSNTGVTTSQVQPVTRHAVLWNRDGVSPVHVVQVDENPPQTVEKDGKVYLLHSLDDNRPNYREF